MSERLRYNNPLPNLPPRGKESFIPPLGETGKGVLKSLLILFTVLSQNALSQTNCEVPIAPVLTLASVQPETGNTVLNWSISPSADIAAYIVYTYKAPDGLPVDTIWNPSTTSYTVSSSGTKYFSISYVVTAFRLSTVVGAEGCTSPLSNVQSTIFCSSAIDTCNRKISITWNKYSDFPKPVKEYKVLVSVNGSPLTEMYTTDKNSSSFLISDFITDSDYCFAIRAVFEDGTYSSSNKSCLSTKMQRPPDWINADYATVNEENKISLSFTVDPMSEIKSFSLSRKIGISGTFQEIAKPVSIKGRISYTDNGASTMDVNYYRLSAINSCNIPVITSNLCSNIVLKMESSLDEIILTWNSYKKWMGHISEYILNVNTGNGFEEKKIITEPDSLFRLSYKEIMLDVTGDEVCFFLKASESSNPYGVIGTTHSNMVCTIPTEIITVPNLFTPDNDLINDNFRPILSFTPKDYHLIISDRKGKVIFETRDHLEEWDGSYNGTPQPQDASLWFLKVTTPSGKVVSKTGTITIIRNR